jgi:phosphohistidine phosphatase
VKTLLILRHAKSSWKDPDLADHDRPLNKRGKTDAPRIGRFLREQDLLPDLILSSSAKRARKTSEKVAEEIAFEGIIEFSRDLYAFGADAYLEALSELSDDFQSVMIVGHNPGLEELLESLSGQYERLPTAALAKVSISISSWSEILSDPDAELEAVWRPKEIK